MDIELDNVDFRLQHPFNCVMSGPSSSGKTTLLTRILLGGSKVTTVKFDRIVYCYGEFLPETFKTLKKSGLKIEFVEGLPSEGKFEPFNRLQNNCLILDDLMQECAESKLICDFFTRSAHHRNISVFLLTQNLFQKGKYSTTILRNASYVILFKSPRDIGQIRAFASQTPNPKALLKSYEHISHKARGYLLVDCTQNINDRFRYRTNILPGEELNVFVPKSK